MPHPDAVGTAVPTTVDLPPVDLSRSPARHTDVLVVGVRGQALVGGSDALNRTYRKTHGLGVAALAAKLGLDDTPLTTRTLPPADGAAGDGPLLLAVALGPAGDPEALRQAAGVAVRAAVADHHGSPSVALALGASTPAEVAAVTEGALLGQYRYPGVTARDPKPGPARLTVVAPRDPELATAVQDAQLVAAAVLQARAWVNTPANLLYPDSFAEAARSYLTGAKIDVEVLDEDELARGGYGGLLAVGGGSARPPRLVRLSYRPRVAKRHLVLVGKGITFDAGGLNLKPADNMYTMKTDMSGAAATVAATRAVADLGLKVNVTCYATMAENLPSATAFRPSDVLTIYGGTTVENGNSDAEGRLVMADALARSAEDAPDLVVDVATLTGAAITALGERTSGLFADDDASASRLLAAAEAAGESFWRLPILEETRRRLDSKVADLRSTAPDRPAGASVAAAFLREFVPAGAGWAHLDIAGTAFRGGEPYGYVASGGTGVGVRTLVALARDLAG
ncbi:leucyl aminopeptidase [Friedmanniella endophytica]|uniref:Probable cytosol aminopeptidase n=1 Tax=Microlunatus kandeliicorticis TaxID=1759536 RepID=A0A7W3ISF9_9ACTN|nr:leucyl aminopeptidase [Microlunatus kandeliicorticis]MBA8794411.1 leucyl aminopeptidase [Microlunatus kandeliicorticis]